MSLFDMFDGKKSNRTVKSNTGWYKCVRCGKSFRRGDINIDHVVPRSLGRTDSENLQCICKNCNKHGR